MEVTYASLFKFVERNIKRTNGVTALLENKDGMGIEFPGYRLSPCELEEGEFATLFLDMRGSTARTKQYGRKTAAVTLHALLPTLAHIVKFLDGFVVDYPGDGIMAHWEGAENDSGGAISNAVKAAGWMDDAIQNIVNPLLIENGIPKLVCGIGIAQGPVTITNLGIPGAYAHKAIGDSVNWSAKLASNKEYPGAILIDHASYAKGFTPIATGSIGTVTYTSINVTIDGTLVNKVEEMVAFKLPRPTDEDRQLQSRANLSKHLEPIYRLSSLSGNSNRGLVSLTAPTGLVGRIPLSRLGGLTDLSIGS